MKTLKKIIEYSLSLSPELRFSVISIKPQHPPELIPCTPHRRSFCYIVILANDLRGMWLVHRLFFTFSLETKYNDLCMIYFRVKILMLCGCAGGHIA